MAKKCWPLPCPQCLQCKGMLQQLQLQDEDPCIELQSEDLAHPSCVGAKEKKHQETGKMSQFFCLNIAGPTTVTAAFCSEHKEDKARCQAALPVCRGLPLGRDHSALSFRISLFPIMLETFRDWLSMDFWPAMLPLPLQCSSCTRNRESSLSWADIYLSSASSLIIIHQKILWHLFFFFPLLFMSPALPLSLPNCNQ